MTAYAAGRGLAGWGGWLAYALLLAGASGAALSLSGVGRASGWTGEWSAVLPGVLATLSVFPAGRWADRRPFPALLAGAGLSLLGAGASALGQPVILSQVLLGLGLGALGGAGAPLLWRLLPAQGPAALGGAWAAALAGLLAGHLGVNPVWFLALLGVGGVLLALARPGAAAGALPPAAAGDTGPRPALLWPGLTALGLVGVAWALYLWLPSALEHYDIDPAITGLALALFLLGGVLGSAGLPTLAARWGLGRGLLIFGPLLAFAALRALTQNPGLGWLGGWLFAAGVFVLSAPPLLLAGAAGRSPGRAGWAAGLVLALGGLGGLLLSLLVGTVADQNAALPLGVIGGAALLSLVAALLGETVNPAPRASA